MVALCQLLAPIFTPIKLHIMCALAFLNLLGTFLERPRSKKLPRTEPLPDLFGRVEAL